MFPATQNLHDWEFEGVGECHDLFESSWPVGLLCHGQLVSKKERKEKEEGRAGAIKKILETVDLLMAAILLRGL